MRRPLTLASFPGVMGQKPMWKIFGVVLALSALAACGEGPTLGGPAPASVYAPPPPPPPEANNGGFRDADFAWSTASGAGQIAGVLAYKGAAAHYSCQDVVLTPETPWSRARMRMLYLSASSSAVPVADVRARTPPRPITTPSTPAAPSATPPATSPSPACRTAPGT
jgi:hypothetical protein